jgi:deoxyribonuclease V
MGLPPVHPEFVPDPSLSREEMEAIQHDIAEAATFTDEFGFDPGAVSRALPTDGEQQQLTTEDSPVVVGVDQAFPGDEAVSALVALQNGRVIEEVTAVAPADVPYVPGLLSFREGGSILAAFEELSVEPDLLVFDGSGRIHFREAGLATHLGVTLDVPSVGVAKNLLCGTPVASTDGLAEGDRVGIEANEDVTAPDGTVIGYALQTRQYDSPNRHVNPLYVSPGHRVRAATTADLVATLCDGYKLPEPTRLADAAADRAKADLVQ